MTALLQRIVNERRRVVLTLGIGLLLNAAGYAVVVYPLARRVDTAEQRAADARQSLRAAQQLNANARATVTGKARADQELRKFYDEVLPANLTGARRITYLRLDQLARQAGLRSEQRTMQVDKERKGLMLRRLTGKLVLEGEYQNVRRFIHQLETAPEFVVIEEVALTQPEGKGPLVLTMEIATYYRLAADGP
jgi:Tfp pilus assembly protein PilO